MGSPSKNDGENNSLRTVADTVLARSQKIRVIPSSERALILARMLLKGAPHFGAHELRDPEIIQALGDEEIGIPTLKKALGVVRQEMTKPPKPAPIRRRSRARSGQETSPSEGTAGEQQDLLGQSTSMQNVSRDKL